MFRRALALFDPSLPPSMPWARSRTKNEVSGNSLPTLDGGSFGTFRALSLCPMPLIPSTKRRAGILTGASRLLISTIVPGTPQTSTTVTVAVIGDFGILMDADRNVDLAVAGAAQGLIGLGDYNYDGSIRGWKAMVQPLTTKGAWFTRGN